LSGTDPELNAGIKQMSFLTTEILRKKRDGKELSDDELKFLVEGFASGQIPDYQATAWLMASTIKGLSANETLVLTRAMKESGQSLDWRGLSANFKNARFADKHSTGGVGDKVSLILAPVAAALGVKVPMMSGRGLGHTGGTVDKLQSIPGFNMFPSINEMIRGLDEVGVCMMCQSAELCPADRKLYSLRDVTATIESVPLITASIVSKKWAEGVDAIVYDVKCGTGAFMETRDEAVRLAHSLVETSKRAGMAAAAWVTRMEEPLGAFVGNALEVLESVYILRNEFPSPLHKRLAQALGELSLTLAAEMAALAGVQPSFEIAQKKAREALESGAAWKIFEHMCKAQGAPTDWETRLAKAPVVKDYLAPRAGSVGEIHSRELGLAGLRIGVGRQRAEDKVDPATGFELLVARGDKVEEGQPLLRAHLRSGSQFEEIQPELSRSFVIRNVMRDEATHPTKLAVERIS
jgi:pyrimidine-nucleoside phosphorylase